MIGQAFAARDVAQRSNCDDLLIVTNLTAALNLLPGLYRLESIEKMSLDPPTYLNSLQNNIRARPIPWEGAVRAGTITDSDLKKIKAVDKVRRDQRRQTVEADTEAYKSLLIGGSQGKSVLESAAKRADVIQYMLVLTGDLINGTATQMF